MGDKGDLIIVGEEPERKLGEVKLDPLRKTKLPVPEYPHSHLLSVIFDPASAWRISASKRFTSEEITPDREGEQRSIKDIDEEERQLKKQLKRESFKEGLKRGVIKVGSYEISPKAAVERTKAIAGATPKAMRAAYGKEERIDTARARKLVRGGLGLAFGGALTRTKFGSAIGRPRVPSGKYMIEGKPVYEEEYQQWKSEQKALNRLTPSATQQATMTMEEEEEDIDYPGGTSPLTPEEVQESKQFEDAPQTYTNEEILYAQEVSQKIDNILDAPNFSRGELKATGGSLLTTKGPKILDAPQFMKGHMRTLGRTNTISTVTVGERPSTNPYGDEYIDIDLGSGKPKLKRRPSEKWMTGESL